MSENLQPQVEVIAERAGVRREGETTLNVLARIIPPHVRSDKPRPTLNLGIVLDRSGSMSGEKLRAAKEAASYAVRQLRPHDRVSVTIFDDEVETIVPSTLVNDAAKILRRIAQVETDGSTALHAGWLEGGVQVSRHLDAAHLNRVLLLTDGQANVGETNIDRICSDVKGLAQRGVSTTTMGIGEDFQEDFLTAMALSGDGNFYYMADTLQLEQMFKSEFYGITMTTGHKVSLGIEPRSDTVVETVYNDLERNEYGRLQLPNLIAGNAVEVVLRLRVPNLVPRAEAGTEMKLCTFRLAWDSAEARERQTLRVSLRLPVLSERDWAALPVSEIVREQVAHKEGLRIRAQAIERMNRGEYADASRILSDEARHYSAAAPAAPFLAEELAEIDELQQSIIAERHAHTSKLAKFSHYRKSRSR